MNKEEKVKWLKNHKQEIIDQTKNSYRDLYVTMRDSYIEAGLDSKENLNELKEELENNLKLAETINIDKYLREESKCKEEVNQINLKPYLDKIRFNKKESIIFLLIKDEKVMEEIKIDGDHGMVNFGINEFENLVMKNKNNIDGVYMVHNHPLEIAAIPSGKKIIKDGKEKITGDLKSLHAKNKICNKYDVKLLDYGVVTEFDYYSAKEKGELQ